MYDVRALNELVAKESAFVDRLANEVGKVIVGQQYMVERILVGLLTGGHVLLEGVPGLAKTLTVRTMCDAIHAKFARIQFTPDLLPADLIGTVVYNQPKGEFTSKLGPMLREHLVLADEINRARRPRCRALFSRRCKSARSPSATRRTSCPIRSSSWRRRTRSSRRAPTHCPRLQVDRFMLVVKVGYLDPRRRAEDHGPHDAASRSRAPRRR